MKLSIHFGAVILALASGPQLQAGSLNPPPGPVAPTNRMTLDAQSIALPYTISQSGSYVLTSNLTGLPGQNGIDIAASNVTLDLNGFTLSGPGAIGVRINGAFSNITIHNGTITGWNASAVDGGAAMQCNLREVIVSSSQTGVVAGSSWFVSGLNISSAANVGLRVLGTNSRIESCHITNCGTGLQVVGTGNLIIRNSAGGGNDTDFAIAAGNSHGPIVNVGGVGDLSMIGGADHPWANFAISCVITTEICDGVDNNCNNLVDESDPQIGLPCSTGLQGECGIGEHTCIAGVLVCEQTQFPVPEVCNGSDDNCDGLADDGNPGCGPNQFCNGGACGCASAFLDCNGLSADGCEVERTIDLNNCGFCGVVCPSGLCSAGLCVLFSNGTPCSNGAQCASSFCVDSVCCDTSCGGTCRACTAALKGWGIDGSCGAIDAGTDPQSECSTSPNLNCNGAGGCGP